VNLDAKNSKQSINSLKPRQKSEKLNFLKICIKINNNSLNLPYNSLDRSWFPLFFRINCAKIGGVLMYFSNFFEKGDFDRPEKSPENWQRIFIMFTPVRDFLLETPWRIITPNPNVNSHSL
jgi:hypothetical protein